MDLEHLTKHQIVLLTLLVSFVTSIATGIVTVSLMQQAPQSITRTINQIVERTVETVAPTVQNVAGVATTQKTIVVKNDDLTAQSIAAVQKSIIRITVRGGDELVARGVIVDKSGTALTDRDALDATSVTAFDAILSDGTRVPINAVQYSKVTTTPFATLAVGVGTSTGFAPARLADTSKLQLGQSVIRVGGKGVDVVGEGVIAMLPSGPSSNRVVQASVEATTPGSLLMSLFGDVIGMTTTNSLAQSADMYTLAVMPIPSTSSGQATKATPKP